MSSHSEMLGALWGSGGPPKGMAVLGTEHIDSAMGPINVVAFADAKGHKSYGLSGKLLTDFDEAELKALLEAAHGRVGRGRDQRRADSARESVFHGAPAPDPARADRNAGKILCPGCADLRAPFRGCKWCGGTGQVDSATFARFQAHYGGGDRSDSAEEPERDGEEDDTGDDEQHGDEEPDSGTARERMIQGMTTAWDHKPPRLED